MLRNASVSLLRVVALLGIVRMACYAHVRGSNGHSATLVGVTGVSFGCPRECRKLDNHEHGNGRV
jgi:hypothetical protein